MRKSSRPQSDQRPGGGPPALVTRMSNGPAAASTAARPASVVMSAATVVDGHLKARRGSPAAVASSASAPRAFSTRSTPASARASAQPRPSPFDARRPAPVCREVPDPCRHPFLPPLTSPTNCGTGAAGLQQPLQVTSKTDGRQTTRTVRSRGLTRGIEELLADDLAARDVIDRHLAHLEPLRRSPCASRPSRRSRQSGRRHAGTGLRHCRHGSCGSPSHQACLPWIAGNALRLAPAAHVGRLRPRRHRGHKACAGSRVSRPSRQPATSSFAISCQGHRILPYVLSNVLMLPVIHDAAQDSDAGGGCGQAAGCLYRCAHVEPPRPSPRNRPPPDLCDHLAPRRGQDHADRESSCCSAARSRWPDRSAPRARRGARGRTYMKLEQERGISVSASAMSFDLRPLPLQPGRHARPQRLLRRHLPHADRRGRRDHGDRRRQGRGKPDPQAVRGLPPARPADPDLLQQDGPRKPRHVRDHRRDPGKPGHRRDARLLAHRRGARFRRLLRHPARPAGADGPRRPQPRGGIDQDRRAR